MHTLAQSELTAVHHEPLFVDEAPPSWLLATLGVVFLLCLFLHRLL
jgi:hypothetical protein